MRFFKFFAITLISFFFIFAVIVVGIYNARISIINNIAQNQFSLVPVKVTCFELSLTSDLSIVVDNLCLQNPKAYISIVDTVIQWPYNPNLDVTTIDVSFVEISGKEHLFSNTKQTSLNHTKSITNENVSSLLSAALRAYLEQLEQFQLPLNINVDQISYLPFAVKNKTSISNDRISDVDQPPYIAKLSNLDNRLLFSLKNKSNTEFFNLEVLRETVGVSIDLSSELKELKSFIEKHRLPISTVLEDELKALEVSGSINSLVNYQADKFTMENQVKDFYLNSASGIGGSGLFTLSGELKFNNQFVLDSTDVNHKENNGVVTLQFIEQNEMLLEYQQLSLLALLERIEVSPIIMSVIKDNPIPQLALKLQGDAIVNLNNSDIQLSYLEMNARNNEIKHQVVLNNIAIALANAEILNALTVDDFFIDSEINLISVPNIAKLTTTPISIHLAGSLQPLNNQTTLNLTESSSILFENIKIAGSTEQNSQTLLSAKSLSTKLTGSVALLANNELDINLTVLNEAVLVNVPNAIKVSSFGLFSEINGSFSDINIKAMPNVDGVELGDFFITGSVQSPKIELTGTAVPLTELLSLNMQLPVNIELIEGALTYNVSGQLIDISNIAHTQFDASVGIKSLSGEVDGIWLQELDWQQQLTIESGNIFTKNSGKENITIALIESFTPISNLSVNTRWSYSDNNFELTVNNFKAEAFNGSIFVPNMHWPFIKGHSANVQLDNIDLAQVLALDKKQGIVVTGNISGKVPVMFDGDKLTIEAGELYNVTNGLIQVINNPAVAELKANNSQLQLAFDALQNLHYHQLSSTVSMLDDGYMQLDTIIKGRNPDIDNDVNLNLNLTYDLLGLLESLSITQRFEDIIIKGLQKNKE